ncbi:MAG: alpha/beta fold hydrolase, partial [Proteobacteria bacterium]|nr:alpha/beta fold hydrolase [Pseudomonadota bacterium]
MIKNILLLLLGLALLNGCMYLQQPSMIFFPYATLDQTPADWGLAYEEVFLDTEDGVRLHGWYIPRHGSKQTLLFFHGNAGNISHRGASVEIFHRLGLNVFIFDYRGYGMSQGKPVENGLYKDARAAWRYLTKERGFDQEDIILFGRSLGGAVAAELAAEIQPGGLILESTFSSAKDVANAV